MIDGVTSSDMPTTGEQLGQYVIVQPIGKGGCGVVYEAIDQRLDRAVALKVFLLPDDEDIEITRKRYRREIDLVKRLEHANVVRFYDYGESSDGQFWMSMELVRGRELDLALSLEGRFSPPRAKRIMLQVASALVSAHEQGIIHRDLKPSNIMLTRQGADEDVVKLLDFGIAKAIGQGEDPGVMNLTGKISDLMATPRYTAPEVLLGEEMGSYTDLYAFGLIFYEMITGEPAIGAETVYEILRKQIHDPLVLPEWLEGTQMGALIEVLTQKEPQNRPSSALELHSALKALDVSGLNPPGEVAYPSASRETARVSNEVTSQVADAIDDPTPDPESEDRKALVTDNLQEIPKLQDSSPQPETVEQPSLPVTSAAWKAPRKPWFLYVLIGVILALLVFLVFKDTLIPKSPEPEASEPAEAEVEAPANPTPDEADLAGGEAPLADMGPQVFTWKLDSSPPGAKVFWNNGEVACETTPCTLEFPKDQAPPTVLFDLEGYWSSRHLLDSRDGDLIKTLSKK